MASPWNSPLTLEGTYFFPIPETASIAEFAIWDGDRRLVGEVRTREEARRIYDEIVRSKRDPGLLETNVPGIFVVGDVRHGSVKRVASGVGEGSVAISFVASMAALWQVWGGARSGIDGGNDGGKGITDTPGGLKLQAEGHDVRYRNAWIKELDLTEANTDFDE